jgi:bifunctional non-homologous end joining protein LigD
VPVDLSLQHEIKWDGYRIIARKSGDRVRLWARSGTDYTTCLDRIRAAEAPLPIGAAVIDGEALAFDAEGQPSFTLYGSRDGERRAVLVAYDLLELDGRTSGAEPLQERRKRLAPAASQEQSGSDNRERRRTQPGDPGKGRGDLP